MSDGAFLTIADHKEYAKRMEDERKRQNHRLDGPGGKVTEIGKLTAYVASLARSVEQMVVEQQEQGARLQALEGRDGKIWRKVVGYAATFAVGAVMAYIFSKFGM